MYFFSKTKIFKQFLVLDTDACFIQEVNCVQNETSACGYIPKTQGVEEIYL